MLKKLKYSLILLIVLSFAGCFSDSNDDDKDVSKKLKIAIVGDSISAGCNPELSTESEMYKNRYGYVHMLLGESYGNINPQKILFTLYGKMLRFPILLL